MPGNKNDQPFKFRTKNLAAVSDNANRNYNVGKQIKFHIIILKSSFCNYSDAYILVKGKIINRAGVDVAAQREDKVNK